MQNLKGKIIFSLILALVVILGLAFYADLPQLLDALRNFQWQFFAAALAITLLNYFLRFVRWHYYLHLLDIRHVPRRDSFLIFLAGMSLTMTPGKLGEVVSHSSSRTATLARRNASGATLRASLLASPSAMR